MSLALDTPAMPARPPWNQRIAQNLKDLVFNRRWLAFVLFLAVWQAFSLRMAGVGLVPSPQKTISTIWEVLANGLFFEHLADSMVRLLAGFLLAMLLGVIVGVLMGSRPFWDEFFKDLVILGLSLPGLIYALLSVVIFGVKLIAPVMAILLASYPFIAVNIREGVRALDKDLLDMTRAYKVGRWRVVRQVILPALLPFILAAIRIGFTIAWKASVLTEVFGASSGVGYMIRISFQLFAVRGILAWSLLFGGVMLLIEYGILLPAERYFARWRPKVKQVI